jgi:vancomycin permeability regulator SanA
MGMADAVPVCCHISLLSFRERRLVPAVGEDNLKWSRWRGLPRKHRYALCSCLALTLGALLWIYLQARSEITQASSGRLYADRQSVPARKVGLVLGTSRRIANGESNQYFVNRVDSAATLYWADKVQYLLVSGDNRHPDYDEPAQMRAALLERGVPPAAIYCDYAGATTLDSVIRAREIFGLSTGLIIISQGFHNRRALYLARHQGIDAIAFNAPDVNRFNGTRTLAREQAARMRAWWDIHIADRQARHLGAMIPVGTAPSSCKSAQPSA